MVAHPGEGHRCVERHPPCWQQPVEEVVKFLSNQERFLVDKVPHLKGKKIIKYVLILDKINSSQLVRNAAKPVGLDDDD